MEPLPASAGDAATSEIALSGKDSAALRQVVRALEGPNYVGRLLTLAGRPIELLSSKVAPFGITCQALPDCSTLQSWGHSGRLEASVLADDPLIQYEVVMTSLEMKDASKPSSLRPGCRWSA